MPQVLSFDNMTDSYFQLDDNASAQCKSVVSAFWLFCRRSHFMLKIPLFFHVFWHLIFALKLPLVWVGTWCKAWIVCFCMYFQYLYTTQFHPKCHLPHSCIEPTNGDPLALYEIFNLQVWDTIRATSSLLMAWLILTSIWW